MPLHPWPRNVQCVSQLSRVRSPRVFPKYSPAPYAFRARGQRQMRTQIRFTSVIGKFPALPNRPILHGKTKGFGEALGRPLRVEQRA